MDTFVNLINFDWGTGNVLGSTYSDFLSVRFTSYLKPPSSTTYSFSSNSDNGSNIYIGGTLYVNKFGVECICNNVFTATLTGDSYYNFLIEFSEMTIWATLSLSWSYTGQSQIIIPSNYYFYPEQVGSTPYQVSKVINLKQIWIIIN